MKEGEKEDKSSRWRGMGTMRELTDMGWEDKGQCQRKYGKVIRKRIVRKVRQGLGEKSSGMRKGRDTRAKDGQKLKQE